MGEARLPGGVIEYRDSGAGPVVVLISTGPTFTPLRAERGIRRDVARFMRAVDRRDLLAAAAGRPAPDSYTLIPLDQPRRLAALVREFVKEER